MSRLQGTSLLAMIAGVSVCAAVSWNNRLLIWPAYLYAFLACWLVTMGGMGLLALGNLTGGRWATIGRPFYLATTQTIWLVTILFIPIGVFAAQIYPWAGETPPPMPAGKARYLDTTFFGQRSAGYIIVWLVLAWLLGVVSRLNLPLASTPGMRRVGAITLVLLVPTATFAAFDWAMSLEPEWYSSIYGALLSAGGVLAAHALAVSSAATIGAGGVAGILRSTGESDVAADVHQLQGGSQQVLRPENLPEKGDYVAEIFNDLGNLLLAFLMVNAYFAVSQFLIIWSANLPSEVTWYLRRLNNGWQWLALALVVLHFAAPFLMLLARDLKREPRRLRRIALWLLVMFAAHLYWMILPAFDYAGLLQHAASLAMLAALSGAWLALFAWNANRNLRHEPVQL